VKKGVAALKEARRGVARARGRRISPDCATALKTAIDDTIARGRKWLAGP